ncbi:hypothetical protein FRB91_007922 [Serendipita sp. 411]|nr:hypothetical protein FRC19_011523 [Serendipita sp. 401]KAG8851433.1 hypothetical protein FRB91_007922 [Serendipita sp. 411]KAG9052212.1 hypothetical protein FS842_010333 [Serendipita sp. 407]
MATTTNGDASLVPPQMGSLKPLTVEKIMESSWKVFQNLEPFCQAICSHDMGQEVVLKITKELETYRETLSKSLPVAEQGFSLAQDNAFLFTCLLNPELYSDEDVKGFLADANEGTKEAIVEVKGVLDLVRANRQGISAVRDELRTVNDKVKEQEKEHAKQKLAAQNRANFWSNVGKAASGVADVIKVIPAHDRGKDDVLLILLPLILPVIEWGANELKSSNIRAADQREASVQRCNVALEQLDTAIDNLQGLEVHLSDVVDWWLNVHTHLVTVGKRLGSLRRPSRLRLEQLQKDFEAIGNSFLTYKSGVTKLLDYYPKAL